MNSRVVVTASLIFLLLATEKPRCSLPGFPGTDTISSSIDTIYLADYSNQLTARLFILYQNASLMINPENIDRITYRPNVNVRAGLSGYWRWFGLALSIDNPFYKSDKEKYGNTSTLDLRLNAFGRQVAGELNIQHYKGFYINSPEQPDGSKYIIPDMSTLSLGVAGYWIYNAKRFSLRSAFIQTEQQKKSAGSLIIRPAFLYYHISSDDGIIPAELINTYTIPLSNQVIWGDFYAIGLSPGYAYTVVFLKNMYLTGAIFPGVAAQFHSYNSGIKTYSDFEFSFQLNGRFAIGYNSDKWFVGGSVQTGFNEIPDKLSNAMFNYDVAQFRIWGGTRFNIFRKQK
jgi:hypothetical protein